MTAVTPAPPAPVAPASGAVRFGRLLLSEWTKIRSVGSTVASLGLLVVLTLGFTALLTWLTVSQWSKAEPSQQRQIIADPVSTILGSGFQLSQLTICVLGVLVITSEYATGMIRASLLAVPRRVPMLAAKSVVFAVLVFIVGELVAFPSFFVGAAILHGKAPVALGEAGVLRAVIGSGLYLAVLGLFALAVGGLVRHTAAGITGVIGFVLVLAPLAQLLPGSFGKHVHAYLPSEAGHLIGQAHQGPTTCSPPGRGWACSACGPRCCSARRPTSSSAEMPDLRGSRRQPRHQGMACTTSPRCWSPWRQGYGESEAKVCCRCSSFSSAWPASSSGGEGSPLSVASSLSTATWTCSNGSAAPTGSGTSWSNAHGGGSCSAHS